MVIDKFVCPTQKTESFSFNVCRECAFLEISRGNKISVHCRKNKEKMHDIAFQSAYILDSIKRPWSVEIEGEKE